MAEITLTIIVTGRVQGVGFRWYVREQADDLQLSGTVRNKSNGTVEVIATGPQDKMYELVARLRSGPAMAMVSDLDIKESDPVQIKHTGFKILV